MERLSKKQKNHIDKHVEKQVDKHLERKVDEHIEKKVMPHVETFAAQFKKHVSTAIIAALSFLIALSWKDLVVHSALNFIGPEKISQHPYLPYLISAIIITVISLAGILIITSWAKKPEYIISETGTA